MRPILLAAAFVLLMLAPCASAQPGGECGKALDKYDILAVDFVCRNEWGGWCDSWGRETNASGGWCTILPPIF